MANKTISDLRELSTVSNNNVLVVETNAETFKVTKENLLKGLATETFVTQKIAEVSIGSTGNTASVFNGLKATFYGDSLTEVNSHYTKGYHSWISDILGFVSYENFGVSGFTIKNVADKVASTNATGDIIFVMAGVNDQTFHKQLGTFNDDSSMDTTYGALKLLCSTLKEKYPTKLIVYITPHYQIRYPSDLGVTSYEVSKAIKEVCYQYGIPVYDNFQLSGIYPQNATNKEIFTTDGCHWNNLGHEKVGKNIAKYMINTFGYVYVSTPNIPSVNPSLVGKTATITKTKFSGYYHLTTVINNPDFDLSGKKLDASITVSNMSNVTIEYGLNVVSIFGDVTGEVTNSAYSEFLFETNIGHTEDGNTITFKTNGTFPRSPSTTYLKIPFVLGVSNMPASFKIDSLTITIDGQEQEVLKMGGFFTEETIEFS